VGISKSQMAWSGKNEGSSLAAGTTGEGGTVRSLMGRRAHRDGRLVYSRRPLSGTGFDSRPVGGKSLLRAILCQRLANAKDEVRFFFYGRPKCTQKKKGAI